MISKDKRNRDINELLNMGFSVKEVAESYGLTTPSIYGIKNRYRGYTSNKVEGLISYGEIASSLGMSIKEVAEIIADVLIMLKRLMENKHLSYSDLTLG